MSNELDGKIPQSTSGGSRIFDGANMGGDAGGGGGYYLPRVPEKCIQMKNIGRGPSSGIFVSNEHNHDLVGRSG